MNAVPHCTRSSHFRIHIGYSAAGRNRWRYFDTLEAANAACEAVRLRLGVILCVEAVHGRAMTLPDGSMIPVSR